MMSLLAAIGQRGAFKNGMAGKIRIGTASWSDPEFVRDWYPKGLAAGRRLEYYADRFDLVEVNSSFYALPSRALTAKWSRQTHAEFIFDIKLHRLLSRHAAPAESLPADLRDGVELTPTGKVRLTPDLETAVAQRFLQEIAPLEETGKLGALLLQLSPSFSPRNHQLTELDGLLQLLAPRKVAVELRHRDWVDTGCAAQTFGFFRERGLIFVCLDAPSGDAPVLMPSDLDPITQPDLAYLRLHGRNTHGFLSGKTVAERFNYDYSDAELREVAARVSKLAQDAQEVHVVYNNNASNYAPRAALRFRELFGQTNWPEGLF